MNDVGVVAPVLGPGGDGLSRLGTLVNTRRRPERQAMMLNTLRERNVLDDILLGADDGEVAVDEHMVRPVDSDHVDFVIAAAQ